MPPVKTPAAPILTATELRKAPHSDSPRQQYESIQEARHARIDAMSEILDTAEEAGRDLLASERRDYDAHDDEIRRLDNLAARVKAQSIDVDRSRLVPDPRGSLAPAAGNGPAVLTADQSLRSWAQSRNIVEPEQDGLSIQRWLRGTVFGDWTGSKREFQASMTEGSLAGGGAMVPSPLSTEIIDLARNQTRVIQAGARTVPMTSSTLKMARVASDPAATWHTEAAVIAPSDATLEVVTFTAHTMTALVQLSRELLEDAEGVDVEIKNALAKAMGLSIDLASLYGTGVAPMPQGVKGATGVTTSSMGANGAAPANYDFLIDALGTLADNNFAATGIIHAPRTERELAKLKDTTGQPLRVPDYVAQVPRYSTNQVPVNLTQGTADTASDSFAADWTNLMIGIRHQFSVQVLQERYADTGQIGLLCWWRGDVQLARPRAFVVTEGLL